MGRKNQRPARRGNIVHSPLNVESSMAINCVIRAVRRARASDFPPMRSQRGVFKASDNAFRAGERHMPAGDALRVAYCLPHLRQPRLGTNKSGARDHRPAAAKGRLPRTRGAP